MVFRSAKHWWLRRDADAERLASGDDRDYCEVSHHSSGLPPIREVTVKTFSQARGIRRPGFQLLTLFQPSPALTTTHLDIPCFLPNAHGIHYTVYLPLACLTVFLLLICNIRQPRRYNASSFEDGNASDAGASPLLSPLLLSPAPPTSVQINVRSPVPNSASKFYSASHARLSHRSLSPHPSPRPSPRLSPLDLDDDDYDELYPAQYATRRDDLPPVFLNGLPPEFRQSQPENQLLTPLSAKFPAPDPKRQLPLFTHRRAASLNWTWSFVAGGRRRRVSLPILTRKQVWAWCRYSGSFVMDLARGRRAGGANLARDMLMDCLSVFLAAGFTWSALCWWFLL